MLVKSVSVLIKKITITDLKPGTKKPQRKERPLRMTILFFSNAINICFIHFNN